MAAPSLPFAGFLDLLRADGLAVGVREHQIVARLLARWTGTNRRELRDALAALIGCNDDDVHRIRALFDQTYPDILDTDDASAAAAAPTHATARRRRQWWIPVVLVAAITAAAVLIVQLRPPALPSQVTEPPARAPASATLPPLSGVLTIEPPPPPPLPPPPLMTQWSWVFSASIAVGALVLSTLIATRLRSRRRAIARDERKRWLGRLPGPFHFFVGRRMSAALPRQHVDDAATILGRAFRSDARARELDPVRTVRETLRRGMLARFVFRRARLPESILVFQDVAQDMALWTSRTDAVIRQLARQGLHLERYFFDGDPRRLSRQPHGPAQSIRQVLARAGRSPMLFISTGWSLAALAETDRAWAADLRRASPAAWLTPVEDASLWTPVFDALPMPVLPMTRAGLRSVALRLVGQDDAAGLRNLDSREQQRTFRVEHVQRIKRLASLVPNPTLELLQQLREQFAPDVPEAAVVHLSLATGDYPASVLRMSDVDIQKSLAAVRTETPELEAPVRNAVLQALRAAEPAAGSAAHVRWQAAVGMQQFLIAECTGADRREALSALRNLAHGPAWEEIRRAAGALPSSSDSRRALAEVLRDSDTDSLPTPPQAADGYRLRWVARPALVDVVASAATAGLGIWALSQGDVFAREVPHQSDAYVLTVVRDTQTSASRLLVNRNDTTGVVVPATVAIYQGDVPFAEDIPIAGSGNAPVRHLQQVKSPFSGRIAFLSVSVEPGAEVKVGQELARISGRDQLATLTEAERELASTRAALGGTIADLTAARRSAELQLEAELTRLRAVQQRVAQGDLPAREVQSRQAAVNSIRSRITSIELQISGQRSAIAKAEELVRRQQRLLDESERVSSMASGRIVAVYKRVGDNVVLGEPIADVETMAAPDAGVAIEPGDTGKHYQARARLPEGNLALSNVVWVPSRDVVAVLIDASPWALVDISANDTLRLGNQATPLVVALEPGVYRVSLRHPSLPTGVDEEIVVSSLANVFRFSLPGFDPASTARLLLAPGGR